MHDEKIYGPFAGGAPCASGRMRSRGGRIRTDGKSRIRRERGTFQITSGGRSANASTDKQGNAAPGWGLWGPGGGRESVQDTSADSTDTSDSAKGLKAGAPVWVSGGTFRIDSIHSNGTIPIAGGTFSLQSGDDGVHADGALVIEDGVITVSQSYEGLEGLSVTINGGSLHRCQRRRDQFRRRQRYQYAFGRQPV